MKSPKKTMSKSKSKDGMRSRSRSRSRVRIPTEKGKLFGYNLDIPAKDRRALLKRLVKRGVASFSEIIKRLNVLAIYNYKRHPKTTKKVRHDMAWVEKNLYSFRKSPMQSPIIGMKNIPKAASIKRKKSVTSVTEPMGMVPMMAPFMKPMSKLPSPIAEKMAKIMSRPDIIKAMSTKIPKKKSPNKKSKSPKKKGKVKSPKKKNKVKTSTGKTKTRWFVI